MTKTSPDPELEAIKDRLDLSEIIGQKVQLRKSGSEYSGKCPHHDDKTASLSVSDKFYKCHAAGDDFQGDVFTWLQWERNCDFKEAVRLATEMAGLPRSNGHARKAETPPEHIDDSTVERYHSALTLRHREYLRGPKRGLTDQTIDAFKLGWDGYRYTIPVYVNGKLVNIRHRKDDDNARDEGPKMLNTKGYGSPARLFNREVLPGCDAPIVCEGEFDAMMLTQQGWAAVTTTHGAGTFLKEWLPLFNHCKIVYVCYDRDIAGKKGGYDVGEMFGDRARMVELPAPLPGDSKTDITDLFTRHGETAAEFADLLAEARPWEPREEPEPPGPMLVHLAQSARWELVGKSVAVKVLAAGKLDAPYLVPRKVRYTCYGNEKDRKVCPILDSPDDVGEWEKTFTDEESTLIDLCHKRKDQLSGILKAANGCPSSCRKTDCKILEYSNIEELLVVPMADRVLPGKAEDGRMAQFDESGNEYVARNVYLLNNHAMVNSYYKITGRVYPHPNTQLGTMLVSDLTPMQDSISQFRMTDEIRDTLSVFQPKDDMVAHVNSILSDLAEHVTHIYKRDEALLAILLTYHSILSFEFEGRKLRRGWMECLLLGDTGTGKTEATRQMMDFCGLGTLASGESSSRTGLNYSVQQIGERWFVRWGLYPLNDRRLLAIDELSELNEEDLGKMTQGRSDGVLRVDRVASAETNCRTRLIWLTNPRNRKQLCDFSHGIEALKYIAWTWL
jgi:hypothetical protein